MPTNESGHQPHGGRDSATMRPAASATSARRVKRRWWWSRAPASWWCAAGRALATHGAYPEAVRRLARQDGIAWFDLNLATRRLWQEQGEEASKASFLWFEAGVHAGYPDGERDDTHLSKVGAVAVAELVTSGLRDLGLV